jgi:Zn-dependent protease with chaperone function
VRGKPLERRKRNFSLSADRYALSLAGPPAHSRRLREIEEEIGAHEERLAQAWVGLVEQHGDDTQGLARAWRALAERWRFDAVNELIERHNLFYPAEARLAMDPRTRDFVPVGGRPYRMRPLDSRWILHRFPPERPGFDA